MKIAVIPARGGSKRIPRKNIKPFAGKPMIAHAIGAAKASGLFERVIVTTDDEEISEIARDYGAETPFVRPGELADDHTPTVPVIAHAIRSCLGLGWNVEHVCCIYPGVPFIQASDLAVAFELLQRSEADYSFPIAEFPAAIQRALKRSADGRMQPFQPECELIRTQDLEPGYYDAGQFYWGSAQAWLTNNRIHRSGVGLVIPAWRVVDIDTPDDWDRAQLMWRALCSSDAYCKSAPAQDESS
ncbi:pseudaminic acid cytidylyltransferase [uncultured Propionivibrio sp.]|uniref:pseudaminic acid cytidylyltransferase n=1 Tax=uncultured Propionivibrio sp. TaxID=426737 RepID=UPI0029C0C501|nr:pseudaminic acid cytidylyltransferase [uncultured Propionivibrio sp.]